jgi:putative two-component system response regulator
MVTSTADARVAVEALERGAYGYVMKPFQINEIVIQVDNALRRRDLELAHRDQEALLNQRVRSATEALRRTQEEVALRLIAAAEYRDNETGAHIRRLGLYAAAMGELLGWEVDRIDQIRMAAPMHDVGKIGIPDAILQKKGKLTPEEWEIMKTHAEIGRRILSDTKIPLLDMGAEVAGGHHERWDGGGYPAGLKGEAIGIEARIVAIVDVYDALTHKRCYKPAWPEEEAIAHIQSQTGSHFDPDLVDLFVANLDTMRAIRMSNPDEA